MGSRHAGRLRLFRYEIRRWPGGEIPDIAEAVESPCRLTVDPEPARRMLALVESVPTPTWGRDELGAGEMWNSNSVTAWVITRAGIDAEAIRPPRGGRAPGWMAGVAIAREQTAASQAPPGPRPPDGRRSTGPVRRAGRRRSVGSGMSDNGSPRLSRAEKNERAFQAHNQRRVELEQSGQGWQDEPVPFVCECDDPACHRAIELTIGEYERAVAPAMDFVVLPGHEDPAVERVVDVRPGYLVVRKEDLRRPGR